MTIAEAAERLGVSQDTIRRRIRAGLLTARREPRPQGFTWVVEVADPARAERRRDVAELELQVARQQEQISGLREAFALAREELVARRREVEELRRQLENAYDRLFAIIERQQAGPGAAGDDSTGDAEPAGGAHPSRNPRVPGNAGRWQAAAS